MKTGPFPLQSLRGAYPASHLSPQEAPAGWPSAGRLCRFGGKVTQRGVGTTMGVLGIGGGDPVEERSQVTHSAVSVWLGAVGDRWFVRSVHQD